DDRVGVRKARLPAKQGDVVAPELVLDHIAFAAHDLAHLRQEPGSGRPGLRTLARRVAAVAATGENGLTERLARDRAGVDADAAEQPALLDDRGALAELRGLYRRPLAGGPAADAGQIEVVPLRHRAGRLCDRTIQHHAHDVPASRAREPCSGAGATAFRLGACPANRHAGACRRGREERVASTEAAG